MQTVQGYELLDVYLSWQPVNQLDWQGVELRLVIGNVMGEAYRRHLALIEEVERNVKLSLPIFFNGSSTCGR